MQLELHMTHIAVLWMKGEKSQSHSAGKGGEYRREEAEAEL